MTTAEFVARARAAFEPYRGGAQIHLEERQRERAAVATMWFQLEDLENLTTSLDRLAADACSDAERTSWLELRESALRDLREKSGQQERS